MSTITLEEKIDIKRLTAIMENLEYYQDKLGGGYIDGGVVRGEAYHTILKNYFMHLDKDGVGKTTYRQRRKIAGRQSGRFFADNSRSLQNVSREMRHTIAGHLYYDSDFENCHPEICRQLCLKHSIACPLLTEYCNDRKAIITRICKVFGVEKDDVKKLFLKALNGGILEEGYSSDKFISGLFAETSTIRTEMSKHYPEFFEEARKVSAHREFNNPLGTGINYVFCYYENEMLQIARGVAGDMELDVGVLAFDGLMTLKTDCSKEFLENVYYPFVVSAIKDRLGFEMRMSLKEPDEAFEVLPEHISKIESMEKPVYEVEDPVVNKYWEEQAKLSVDKSISERYIPLETYDAIDNNKLVAIKGNMGCAKTFALIEKTKNNRTLFVSYRCSLDNELARKSNCQLYSDFSQPYINCDRLVVQIDSVWRAAGTYDVVILDEVGYMLNHLFSFTKEKNKCIQALKHYLQSAKTVVMMDALLQKRHIECIKEFSGAEKCFVIQNDFKVYPDYKVVFTRGNRFTLYDKIKKAYEGSKKVCVPSNSLEAIKFVEANMKAEFEDCKVLVIDKDTEVVNTSNWNKYDIVMYTPTVEAGVSYDSEYFDVTIAYMSNRSNSPSNFAQQLLRIRNLRDKVIEIVSSMVYERPSPLTIDGIIDELEQDSRALISAGLEYNYGAKAICTTSFYNSNYFKMAIGNNHDKRQYQTYVKNVLREHGMTVIDGDSITLEKDLKDHLDVVKGVADTREKVEIFNARKIDFREFENLEKNIKNNSEDIKAIKKYKCESVYGFPDFDEKGFTALYDMQSEFKNLKLVYRGESWVLSELKRRGQGLGDIQNNGNDFIDLDSGVKACRPILKVIFTMRLMKDLGFDLHRSVVESKVLTGKIDNLKLLNFIKANEEQYLSITKVRSDLTKVRSTDPKAMSNVLRTVKNLIESLGFTFESKQVQEKGERDRVYTIYDSFSHGSMSARTRYNLSFGNGFIEDFETVETAEKVEKKGVRLLQKARKEKA